MYKLQITMYKLQLTHHAKFLLHILYHIFSKNAYPFFSHAQIQRAKAVRVVFFSAL